MKYMSALLLIFVSVAAQAAPSEQNQSCCTKHPYISFPCTGITGAIVGSFVGANAVPFVSASAAGWVIAGGATVGAAIPLGILATIYHCTKKSHDAARNSSNFSHV